MVPVTCCWVGYRIVGWLFR